MERPSTFLKDLNLKKILFDFLIKLNCSNFRKITFSNKKNNNNFKHE